MGIAQPDDQILQIKQGNNCTFVLRFEDFDNNFDETSRSLMKKFEIVRDDKSMDWAVQQLGTANKFHVHERSHKSKNKHVTSGTYDRDEQISYLLKNKFVCKEIKQMVKLFDYKWEYNDYC